MLYVLLALSAIVSFVVGSWLKQCQLLESKGFQYDLPPIYYRPSSRLVIGLVSAASTLLAMYLSYLIVLPRSEKISYAAPIVVYIVKHIITSIVGTHMVSKHHDLNDMFGMK